MDIKGWLEERVHRYNQPGFVESDPIQVPHRFSAREDIEIAAFLTATLAWGNRLSIIRKANQLMEWMEQSPADFVRHASGKDLARLSAFRHRTFGGEDCLWFVESLRNIYERHGGLESVFSTGFALDGSVYSALRHFRRVFFETEGLPRSAKHVSNVERGSAAKRLNLMLMWLVRKDDQPVHFGLWKAIPSAALMIPLDVHLGRVSRKIGLLSRKTDDWKAVEELTHKLRLFDPTDPVKYDFALFGAGIFEKE